MNEPHGAYSIEAEQACLGACLIDGRSVLPVQEVLSGPGDFYREAHQDIWQAMLRLQAAAKPVDLITVCEALRGSGRLDDVGGAGYLDSLTTISQSAAHASAYAQTVADLAHQRRLERAGLRIRSISRESGLTPQERTERCAQVLQEAMGARDRSQAVTVGDAMGELAVMLTERALQRQRLAEETGEDQPDMLGHSTGFPRLDRLTGGLGPGEVWVVGARPAMGKTAFGWALAEALARQGPVYFACGDMSRPLLARRPAAQHHSMDIRKVTAGHAAAAAEEYEYRSRIWIDHERGISAATLAAKIAGFKLRHGLAGVVVDYLNQYAEEDEHRSVSTACKAITTMAGRLEVPVVLLQQLSRKVEDPGRKSKVPQVGDLRDSGRIEQDATIILGLYRPWVYETDPERKAAVVNTGRVYVLKNRDGPANCFVPLHFEPKRAQWTNLPAKPTQGTLTEAQEAVKIAEEIL